MIACPWCVYSLAETGGAATAPDVGAGDERLLARAGQDDDANFGVILDGRECLLQLLHGRHVQRVQNLGPVDGDVSDVVFRFRI